MFSFSIPARACRSSTFCVTRRNSSACFANFAIASCAAFGRALRMRCRRSPYHSQTNFGSWANASGSRQLRRIEIPPVTLLAAERRDPALSGNARASNHKSAHFLKIRIVAALVSSSFGAPSGRALPADLAAFVLFFQPTHERLEVIGHGAGGDVFTGRFFQDFAPI